MKPVKLPTIAMTPMTEYYYDPIPRILSGEKVHTLRKQRCHGRKEVVAKGKRTGIVLEFHGWIEMTVEEYATNQFAMADGFDPPWNVTGLLPWECLIDCLNSFYSKLPETMWCNYFRVVQRPEEVN